MRSTVRLFTSILFFAAFLLGFSACNKLTPSNYSYKILFMEQEQFVEPYPTRVIITPEFIRFDDGDNSQDFVLYDRKKDVVHSVVSEENTIMSVHRKKSDIKSPVKLKYSEKDLGVMEGAPKVDGVTPHHYQLLVNDKVCNDVIAVKNILPAAVTALSDFALFMATDSKLTLSSVPADTLSPCDLAKDTFAPTRHLKFGFPVQIMGSREYARTLVDFDKNYKADRKLFELPSDYKRYTVQDLREGKVKFE